MAHIYYLFALTCLFGLSAAEPSFVPGFFYPVEHRSDIQTLKDQEPAADSNNEEGSLKNIQDQASLNGYNLEIIPADQFPVTQYDPSSVSLLSLVWDFLPSPITIAKGIFKKIWKIVKFLMPLNLILLGMALVVGFCAFTPYCTLIIEKPFARHLKSISGNIPYMDDMERFFYEAYDKFNELQSKESSYY